MSDNGDWFAPKAVGIGSGLPIAWQGWALTLAFGVTVTAVALLLVKQHPVVAMTIIVALSAAFMLICAQHTRGGWKWRWRGED